MFKGRGIWRINLPFSAALEWCKEIAGRYGRPAAGREFSITARRPPDRFEVARPTNVGQTLQVDCCGMRIELKELIKVLSVGDRIQVRCNDGVFAAEKVSDTKFELIHSQALSELVH